MWTRRCDQTELHDKMQQKSGNLKLRGAKIRCKTLVLIMQLYAEYTALVAVLHFDGCMKYFAVYVYAFVNCEFLINPAQQNCVLAN